MAKPGDNVIGQAVAFGNGGLYYAAQWISPLFGRNRKTRGARADGEEQVT